MSNKKIYVDQLILGVLDVLEKAWDSIIILIAFSIGVLRWIGYERTYRYSYLPDFATFLIATIKIAIIVSVNIFLIKRILYQIEDKEINVKKILSLESIWRGIMVVAYLLMANIFPYAIIFSFVQDLENKLNNYSFLGLIFIFISMIVIFLFLIILNFIIVYFEKNPLDSFEYMLKLMAGYKLKLIIINSVIFIIMGTILYEQINSMYSIFMTSEEVRRIESTIRNVSVFFSYIVYLLHLGYYKALKFHKEIEISA